MSTNHKERNIVVAALLLIIGAAAYFRLADLGLSSLRADTIVFWNVCQNEITGGKIMEEWLNIMGLSGQFPFPMAFTKWFVDLSSLPLDHFSIRLPSALWGIATVAVAYGAGQRLGGARLGLLFAALFAVNPFHIQTTREVYYYAPLVMGATLMLWGVIWTLEDEEEELSRAWGSVVVNVLGFGLVTYSQPVGWPMAFVCILLVVGVRGWRSWQAKKVFLRDIVLAGAYGVVGWPLLSSPWGLKQMQQISTGAARESALAALATSQGSMASMLHRSLTSFAWGSTTLRTAVTVIVLVAALAFLVRQIRGRKVYWVPLVIILPSFALAMIGRARAGAMYEPRYVVPLLPVYLLLLGVGIMALASWIRTRVPRLKDGHAFLAIGVLAVALNVYPAQLCTEVTGRPTPYKKLIEVINTTLPQQSLVLVDRWFEPWNELKVYPSTNATFTFTVPNEPIETFLRAQWRKTAVNFFAQYPNAAYLEMVKSYWNEPEVGQWDWPRQYFAHEIAVTNEAGFGLRELGLASRGGFYHGHTNPLVVQVFYNTREDLFYRAQQLQTPTYALFGEGWGYTKTQQDYRDWRLLEGRAVVELYNATAQPIDIIPRVVGAVASGSKQVKSDGETYTFSAGQLQDWRLARRTLQPGLTAIELRDDLWDLAQIPLLVAQVSCELAPPEAPDVQETPQQPATATNSPAAAP